MSSPITPQTNAVLDTVRALVDDIIDSVVNLLSENTDTLLTILSPLSTAVTATTSSENSSAPVSTVQVGNDGKSPIAGRSLVPLVNVPMSEEMGEHLFSEGYDSDGLMPCYYPEDDIELLNKYSSMKIKNAKEMKHHTEILSLLGCNLS